MEFMHESVLYAGLALLGAFFIALRRKAARIPYPVLGELGGHVRPSRFWLLPLALVVVAAALFLVAGARPRTPVDEIEKKLLGVDVALALDLSKSMLAEDLEPNRMEAAKARVMEFAKGFTGGRLTLVAFSGRSFTQCPLTTDTGIVSDLVEQLDVGAVTIDGTAIGDAILNSINRLTDEDGSRIIILLTDGENNVGADPVTAAVAARDKGIRIYSVAVGTEEGAPVPQYTPYGVKYYLRNPDGSLFMSKADEETLREISGITGGRFFRAADPDTLGKIYKRISELEKKEILVKKTGVYRELFQYPAGAGLFVLLISAVLGAGRFRRL
jgi:Ca-activated chloride channel family protein